MEELLELSKRRIYRGCYPRNSARKTPRRQNLRARQNPTVFAKLLLAS